MSLDPKLKATLKAKLHKLDAALRDEIASTKRSSAPVELDQQSVGRVSRIDAIQQQQMNAASLRRLEQRLEMVVAALAIIDSDSYGICAMCEEPIALKRLEARPESRICIRCAKGC